ncbi:PREDICTED: putative sodium-dependent multivitamin transporter isoform X2 [Vollenhovia emeryi]|uniref:putative sodium-dependent multivitamin transporter isoform X2 n=1 Tax=Vollenhovia emeryi TaxID=411798 RepID=UPI0005F3EDE0|nr:PREDICTED: putative sodium-dependent multivitamin transporter isoform X2 [Vollenhovia emeryi]
MATLTTPDYAVITAFLLISFFIGVYYWRRQRQKSTEYLQKRFGTATRLIASFAFLLQLLLYTGVVLYAPALALEATTGISKTASVIGLGLICTFYSTIGGIKAVLITDVFQGLLMLAAVVTIIATAAVDNGGLDRIWQIAGNGSRLEFDNISVDPTVRHTWWSLTLGGFFTYLSLYSVNQVQVQRMLTVSNLAAAQRALWWSWPMASIMSLTLCFSGLAIYAKYHDCDPLTEGRIASNDQLMPLYVMDTLSDYPGVPGLFIAGIFSAGLSTISATVNSLSAVILEDYIKLLCRVRNKELSAAASVIISKILALVVGLACVAVAFLTQYLGGLLQAALTIFGVVGGPMLGLYTLGMFLPSCNQRGAITGFVLSLMFSLWIGFGQPKPPIPRLDVSTDGCRSNNTFMYRNDEEPLIYTNLHYEQVEEDKSYFYLYRISYMWYCPLGFLLAVITGSLVSWTTGWIFRESPAEIDSALLSPIVGNRIEKRREADKYRSTIKFN